MYRSLTLIIVLLSSVLASQVRADRSKNSGSKVTSFPQSKNPGVEKALIAAAKNEVPFDDKKILKVAVTRDWGPWVRNDERDIPFRQLFSEIAVFDSQNKKCWDWHNVEFRQQQGSTKIYFFGVPTVYGSAPTSIMTEEIDCALVSK